MSTYKTQGIIIKRNNFGEANLLLGVYTKDYGKIEVVARSARKAKGKLKGHLELFLFIELILANGRNIDTITSSCTVENFFALRNNLDFSFGAYYILELIDKMTLENHKDERIFHLLKEILLFLDELIETETQQSLMSNAETKQWRVFTEDEKKYYLAILFFQINILGFSGFLPELNKCVFCLNLIISGKNYFSFSKGGVICNKCVLQKKVAQPKLNLMSHVLINDNTIKLLRLFQFENKEIKKYNQHIDKCFEIIKKIKVDEKLILDSIFLMNSFIEFNIERKINGVNFLKGI